MMVGGAMEGESPDVGSSEANDGGGQNISIDKGIR